MHSSIQVHFQFNFGSTKQLNSFEVDEGWLRLVKLDWGWWSLIEVDEAWFRLKIKNFNVNKVNVWNNLFAIVLPMKLLLKSILEKKKVYFQNNAICINPQKRFHESSENLSTYQTVSYIQQNSWKVNFFFRMSK